MRLGWHLPLERLSASSMSMFVACPESFRRKYLLHHEEKSFGARFVGLVDHRVNARIMEAKMSGDTVLVDDIYAEVWNDTIESDGDPDWRDDDPVKMMTAGIKMAETYLEAVGDKVRPIAIEQRIEVEIPSVPSKIIGYVDVMEAHQIRERKTVGQKVTKPKPKWRFQGLVYQLATGLPVRWDVVTRQVTPKVYLCEEHEDLYLPYRSPDATVRMIEQIATRLNDMYGRYGRDNPWPTDGVFHDFLCGYCPAGPRYKGDCSIWQT